MLLVAAQVAVATPADAVPPGLATLAGELHIGMGSVDVRDVELDPATGQIAYINGDNDTVVMLDPAGHLEVVIGNGILDGATSVAITEDGIYVASFDSDRVEVFDRNGTHIDGWDTDRPVAIAAENAQIYVAEQAGEISVYSLSGVFLRTVAADEVGDPNWLPSALDVWGGEVYVARITDDPFDFLSTVEVFDAVTGQHDRTIGTLWFPWDLEVDDNGEVWVADGRSGTYAVTVIDGMSGLSVGGDGGFSTAPHIAVDPGGRSYWIAARHSVGGGLVSHIDVYTWERCRSMLPTIVASSYNDSFIGTAGDDIVFLGDGDDTFAAGFGDDIVCGGQGSDVVNGQWGADKIWGEDAADTLYGADGNDELYGGPGWDTMQGNDGDDIMNGDEGNDNMNAGSGLDRLWGSTGHDLINAGGGDDSVIGGPGNDRMNGQSGNDIILGRAGDDLLWGSFGNDLLYGQEGRDWIWAGWGADLLDGGDGNDRLYGEQDDDLLLGQAGWDLLDGGFGIDDCDGGAGVNTINACEP